MENGADVFASHPGCPVQRSQYARSIGPDSGCSGPELPQMRITSEAASISQKNVSEVVDSLKPEVNPVINSYVGPALDAIRSRHQQRNNSNATTVITTRIVDAAKGFEKKISDAVTPLLGNQGNQAPPKNPNDSQNPQTNPPNVPGTDYRGAFDLQRPENKEKFGGLPMTSNPGAVVNFVDEYGRKIVGTVPTAFNAAIGNSNAYLKAFYDNLKGMVH
ncbi:uncharacterized protein [Venturia canescens]|uniref:uncharacterized protein n=1 Tax=Venturia canescens TaxID=32260 RepID=UPI001C9D5130|nr:uncharacterized protein LOC122417550 [Venturia canescens]